MKQNIIGAVLSALFICVGGGQAFGWGRGGGGGGAVGGYHGGSVSESRSFEATGPRGTEYSGSRSGEASGYGGYRGGEVSGSSSGEISSSRGGEISGSRSGEVGGYRGGEVSGARTGEVSGYRGGEVGHTAVATDFGFGHVAGAEGSRAFVSSGHYTTPYSGAALAANGAAVRGGFYRYGGGAFNAGWWGGHPGAWHPGGWNYGWGWGWATPFGLGLWFGWTAPPLYYDYGNTIVYQGDTVYINGQPGPTAPVYYQQAADLALAAPATPPMGNTNDWQPLGTFSLVQGQQSEPSAIFQLAVNKAGIIAGNYFNILTGTTLAVRGSVDPKTQRASWIVGDQTATVYDTGIYNLTRDQSPLLIHFGKDRTQQWLLVRIPENAQGPPPAASQVGQPPPPPPIAVNNGGNATVTVLVPADAAVFFEGVPTSLTGTERTFTTPKLEPGMSYEYTVRARWTQDGAPVEQTQKVLVKAGAQARVTFGTN